MLIGVGLPSRADSLPPDRWLAWAEQADRVPFSSLAALDRVAYPGQEPMIALASLIGVTSRIRLMASIVLAPTRETTLLARQAASLDSLSGGRFTLGVGVGIRRDDYLATGFLFEERGHRLDSQLPLLRRIWAGSALDAEVGPVGCAPATPGGPELLIGGYAPAVARRIATYGDGFMAPGGGEPGRMADLWRSIEAAWTAAGRSGRPRRVGSSYVALGPDAQRQAADYIGAAYAFDPVVAARRLQGIPTNPAALRGLLARQRDDGVDEFILRPCSADPTLIQRLADEAR